MLPMPGANVFDHRPRRLDRRQRLRLGDQALRTPSQK